MRVHHLVSVWNVLARIADASLGGLRSWASDVRQLYSQTIKCQVETRSSVTFVRIDILCALQLYRMFFDRFTRGGVYFIRLEIRYSQELFWFLTIYPLGD